LTGCGRVWDGTGLGGNLYQGTCLTPLAVVGDVGEDMGLDGVDVSSEHVEWRGRGELELERETVDSTLIPGSSVMAIQSDVNDDNSNRVIYEGIYSADEEEQRVWCVDLTFWGVL
jgi:hypothetical protein